MRRFGLGTLRLLVLLLLGGFLTAIILRWISLERWRWQLLHTEASPVEIKESTPTPEPTAPRQRVIGGRLETARLFSGITVRPTVEETPGRAASEERVDPLSYVLDLKLQVRVPTPNRTMEELAQVSPELPRLLPGLAAMLKPDSVAPFFSDLYELKVRNLRNNLGRLDQLLSRHNFYDCQTVLSLKHPETGRKAVLIQAEMDVDADGSDADRLPGGSGTSPNFQPMTSYRWPKKTTNPNPYLGFIEDKRNRWEAEAAQKSTNAERKRELKSAISSAQSELNDLKKFSFLIGTTDPFIVIPGGFTKAEGAKVGDYAVVIAGEAIYPALVGDVGPADKAGEASLRIAKEINQAATAMNRPVSDLKVSYLIFPDTADKPWGPPELDKIQARCEALVNEIGGAGVPLHKWIDIIPKPTPTPTATATATATPSPSVSPSPGASPASTFAYPLATPSPSPSPTPTPSPLATPPASPSPSPSEVVRRSPAKKKNAAKKSSSPAD